MTKICWLMAKAPTTPSKENEASISSRYRNRKNAARPIASFRPELSWVSAVISSYGVLDVKAYSNAAQAHLWLNGKEQGATSCAEGVCLWRGIHLVQGANELRATADIGGVETSDTLQWTFAGSPGVVRIKAGDISGYLTRDNERYGSDMYFVGGEGKSIDPPDTPVGKRSAVTGAVDPHLCDSYREGEFAYHIPVPGGRRYRITARFVEPTATTPRERVFDVDVNGKRMLNEFDVFAAAGGKLKSVERTFDATAKDGYLVITFRASRGRALVSSLSIAPSPDPSRL